MENTENFDQEADIKLQLKNIKEEKRKIEKELKLLDEENYKIVRAYEKIAREKEKLKLLTDKLNERENDFNKKKRAFRIEAEEISNKNRLMDPERKAFIKEITGLKLSIDKIQQKLDKTPISFLELDKDNKNLRDSISILKEKNRKLSAKLFLLK